MAPFTGTPKRSIGDSVGAFKDWNTFQIDFMDDSTHCGGTRICMDVTETHAEPQL